MHVFCDFGFAHDSCRYQTTKTRDFEIIGMPACAYNISHDEIFSSGAAAEKTKLVAVNKAAPVKKQQ